MVKTRQTNQAILILSVMILADISTEFVVAQHGKVFHCHLFYKESANGIFSL